MSRTIARAQAHAYMFIDMGMDMYAGIHVNVCADMWVDVCMDMFIVTCSDTHTDTFIGMCAAGHVCRYIHG